MALKGGRLNSINNPLVVLLSLSHAVYTAAYSPVASPLLDTSKEGRTEGGRQRLY